MKGFFSNWFGSSPVAAVTSGRTCIAELIKRRGFASVGIRSVADTMLTDTVFVLEIDSHAMCGHGSNAMINPEMGKQVWRFEEFTLTHVTSPSLIPIMNEAMYGSLRARVEQLASDLQYDERVCIYKSKSGERVYVHGGFNHHESGFTGLRTYPTERNPKGNCAAFISYALAPYYCGQFFLDGAVVEQIPDFIYYQWMGNRVRNKEHLKPMQVSARADAIQTLESMLQTQRVQTRNMESLLYKLKQAHLDVHE